ncbi:accessory gland protein Acp29AB [Drosophila erecta]|uniref:C-type lectin domain-containing protein n=1 Tax=Drosophila erecta TaxID=7220 RepID=B3NA70_DROER|nr:accessory gland protein Acp29AB [Drosophila erecta]EDV57533.1 uncharacterized protein Dere_GG24484 [Drosophila erecta]
MVQLGAAVLIAFIVWNPYGSQAKSSEELVATPRLSVSFQDMIPLLDYITMHRCKEADKLAGLEAKQTDMQTSLVSLLEGRLDETLEKLAGLEAKQADMQQSLASMSHNENLDQETIIDAIANSVQVNLAERLTNLEDKTAAIKDTLDNKQMESALSSQLAAIQESLSSIQSSSSIASIVPAKFRQIGSKLIYVENNLMVNWVTAARMCRAMGGYLASIDDEDDLAEIRSNLYSYRYYWLSSIDLEGGADNSDNNEISNTCVELSNNETKDQLCTYENFFICESAV